MFFYMLWKKNEHNIVYINYWNVIVLTYKSCSSGQNVSCIKSGVVQGRNYRRGWEGGVSPPPQSLSEIHSSGKSQKVELYDIKIHQGAVKYYQLCCERWERKLQTFHDVADIAFKNRFILPTTYKCLPQSVWRKLKGHFVKWKQCRICCDLIVPAALTGFELPKKVESFL